jgi:hypothetical protein
MTTAMEVTIKWTGQSGAEYEYWIYPIDTTFNSSPGNYIFAKETRPGYWAPVYIGQTSDLGDRLGNHEKEKCARRNGATHIHAHRNDTESARRNEERDLVLSWRPPCNG